ncbi:STE24 endopeptidase [Pancytospora philotis]|nr:STE24 endopeptidase [Pancytospora philotis]
MLLAATMAILGIDALAYTYLLYRQKRALAGKQTQVTQELFTGEEYTKAVSYSSAKVRYSIFLKLFELVKTYAHLRILDSLYANYLKGRRGSEMCLLYLSCLLSKLFEMPTAFYFDFVIERAFGFNNKTVFVFLKDCGIDIFLGFVFTSILGYVSLLFIGLDVAKYWMLWWAMLSVLIVVLAIAYPTLIMPLFNKLSLLDDGSLKTRIQALAEGVGFTGSRIFVMDGSKRSNHSNAFLCGFGNMKRIVLYDTILKQLSEDEILAVLAHELGHWRHSHVFCLQAISIAVIGVFIYMFNRIMCAHDALSPAFQLIYFMCWSSILDLPLSLFKNCIVRMLERQADRYSVGLGHGEALRSGLIKIGKENMSAPVYDPLFSVVNNSHPTLAERLELIDAEMKKQK